MISWAVRFAHQLYEPFVAGAIDIFTEAAYHACLLGIAKPKGLTITTIGGLCACFLSSLGKAS